MIHPCRQRKRINLESSTGAGFRNSVSAQVTQAVLGRALKPLKLRSGENRWNVVRLYLSGMDGIGLSLATPNLLAPLYPEVW